MSDYFEASCLCGGIKLSYSGPIGPANYRHCEDCRRVTGSAFNIGVRVARKNLKITTSSRGAKEVCHCTEAGVVIFFRVGDAQARRTSQSCPEFPARVEPR